MRNFLLIISLITCLLFNTVVAQVEYVQRVETELKDDFVNESILEFGEKGLIVRSKRKENIGGQEEWQFQKINTDLQ